MVLSVARFLFFALVTSGILLSGSTASVQTAWAKLESTEAGGASTSVDSKQKEFLEKVELILSGQLRAKNDQIHVSQDLESKLIEAHKIGDEKAIQAIAWNLAQTYLNMGRPQEALWTLRRGYLYDHALYLEARLVHALKTGVIVKRAPLGRGGASDSEFLEFENGLKAIAKGHRPVPDKWGHRREVLAYELDRILDFNFVPITVLRVDPDLQKKSPNAAFPGEQSLQLFLDFSQNSNLWHGGFADNNAAAVIFDALISNADRHGGNSLKTPEGYFVMIDHGHTLYPGAPHGQVILDRTAILPSARVLAGLHQDAFDEFTKRGNDILDSAQIEQIKSVWLYARQKYPLSEKAALLPLQVRAPDLSKLDAKSINFKELSEDLARALKDFDPKEMARKHREKLMGELKALNELEATKGETVYTKFPEGELSANGQKIYQWYLRAKAGLAEADGLFVVMMLEARSKGVVGGRETRREIRSVLQRNLSAESLALLKNFFAEKPESFRYVYDHIGRAAQPNEVKQISVLLETLIPEGVSILRPKPADLPQPDPQNPKKKLKYPSCVEILREAG